MGSDRPIDRVLGALEDVERHNGYFRALCPAHDDHSPSLDIKEVGENDQKKVILKCQAGCETAAVLEKVGLEWKDLFSSNGAKSSDGARSPGRIVATYDYTDAAGNLLHQTVRYEPKRFLQRRPDGEGGWVWELGGIEPVLYNLPRIYRALLDGDTIYVLEGEKDCNRAWEELGVTATTCSMGAQKWRESYTHVLAGADVILVPDNDEPGGEHAEMVATELLPFAASVKILKLPDLPEKGDLSDWIDAGGTREEFDPWSRKPPNSFSPLRSRSLGRKYSCRSSRCGR